MSEPQAGDFVTLRHVRGERGVTRGLDGATAVVLAVWHYAGGLVRVKVRVDAMDAG